MPGVDSVDMIQICHLDNSICSNDEDDGGYPTEMVIMFGIAGGICICIAMSLFICYKRKSTVLMSSVVNK